MSYLNRVVGPYWAESNRQFEATKPTGLRRAARSLNPLTGLGSAIGSMQTASSGERRDQ